MRNRYRDPARALVVAWGLMGGSVAPLAGEDEVREGHDARRAAPAAALPAAATASATVVGCPVQIDCGADCTAPLQTYFCVQVIDWEARISVGGVTIGPGVRVECQVCDCWYVAPGPNGSTFQRRVELGCGASFPGLEHE